MICCINVVGITSIVFISLYWIVFGIKVFFLHLEVILDPDVDACISHWFKLNSVDGDDVCVAGGQSVSEPGSRGFTGAHGVSAGLWLRYLALLLDTAGLQRL